MKKILLVALIALGIVGSAVGVSMFAESQIPSAHACSGNNC